MKTTLLDYGVDSIWNDNNEFEIWDSSARCHVGTIGSLRYQFPLPSLLQEINSSHTQTHTGTPNDERCLNSVHTLA